MSDLNLNTKDAIKEKILCEHLKNKKRYLKNKRLESLLKTEQQGFEPWMQVIPT